MKADDKNQPNQTEKQVSKPQQEMGLDVHPIKAAPLNPQPPTVLNPLPATGPNVSATAPLFNDREQIFLFIIVILVVALAGVSLIYASKYAFQR